MKVLAIIPARGGSKGVPDKNIKMLGNKPLIVHAIDCAKQASLVSEIVVTTDSDEIIDVVKKHAVQVVKRPANLAQDSSNVVDAVVHILESLPQKFDVVVLLQPTSPLRTGKDLDQVIQMLFAADDLDGVISVVPFDDCHPARMYNLLEDNYLQSYVSEGETLRRQDLKPVYYRNGCFYAVKIDAFVKQKSFMVKNKKAYVMDVNWLVNIDSPRDFKIAEVIYEEWKNANSYN
ncbi:acylneuraminate cytidylyltransferase family protein [Flavobacterium agricola]|uniref:Acylneuraminate cytidylyltransferase family protein n=1 Tax=Flavobacterium agricola TaxID=2870839 RepID=A0ABY6M012_9FLAO|nr:acylneuraminate cytidylyltransferase family protein [Flavobacterium agricola]UYW00508.1 acylneuraminate cytidylyltransferase family protein [Flavobacterium agricola]